MLEPLTGTTVDLATSSARLGVGVFETIRVENGRPLLLHLHLERLAEGCRLVGLDVPPPAELVLERAASLLAGLSLGALRLVAVDGGLLIDARTWSPDHGATVRLVLGHSVTRLDASLLCRVKSISYLENVLLAREAQTRAAWEAIAANQHGRLADGSRSTLYVVQSGLAVTPPSWDGALPGVVRRVLLAAGLVSEHALTPKDLVAAEAVFLTNALNGVVPVHQVENGLPKNTDHPAIVNALAAWRAAAEAQASRPPD
jgi:branched-chain amino acid aminotransferase